MPTYGLHLTDGSELQAAFLSHIKDNFRGKPGPYLLKLVEQDLSKEKPGDYDALGANALVDITRRLLGELDAQDMAKLLEGKDQPRVLRGILTRYLLTQEVNALAAEGQATYRTSPNVKEMALEEARKLAVPPVPPTAPRPPRAGSESSNP